jgi:outer membrane protein OmpA-like peptidoglycan-associated protein
MMLVGGCQNMDSSTPGPRATTGAAVGAAVGGLAGAVLGDGVRGPALGAAAGAVLGGGIGYLLDRQRSQLEEVLVTERQERTAAVERVDGDALKVTINDHVAFDRESTAIREEFLPTLERVAAVLAEHPGSHVTVVGYTDAAGPDDLNRQLSEKRAMAVRDALVTYGVDPARIFAEGLGEAEPRADNRTAEGRAENRRVEILITPLA